MSCNFSIAFIKSLNQSSFKPCLIDLFTVPSAILDMQPRTRETFDLLTYCRNKINYIELKTIQVPNRKFVLILQQ